MAKFRKKPVEVDAFQFDGDLMDTNGEYYVPSWAVLAFQFGRLFFDSSSPLTPPCELHIQTLDAIAIASVGDWIIQGTHGELYPCKPDIFAETYEPVDS